MIQTFTTKVLMIGAVMLAVLMAAAPAQACRRPANWTPPSEVEREANYRTMILSEASTVQIAEVVEVVPDPYLLPRITFRAVEAVSGNLVELATTGELIVSSRCDGMPNLGWYRSHHRTGDVVVLVMGNRYGEFGIIHAELIDTPRAIALIASARETP